MVHIEIIYEFVRLFRTWLASLPVCSFPLRSIKSAEYEVEMETISPCFAWFIAGSLGKGNTENHSKSFWKFTVNKAPRGAKWLASKSLLASYESWWNFLFSTLSIQLIEFLHIKDVSFASKFPHFLICVEVEMLFHPSLWTQRKQKQYCWVRR